MGLVTDSTLDSPPPPVCVWVFWEHCCNFKICMFNVISDFCVQNVVFINSIPVVNHPLKREKMCCH